MYGMGTSAIAEKLNCSIEEADEIKSGFFKEFPNVEKWIDDSHKSAYQLGYVEDFWGRRRRLPDLLLPKYEVTIKNSSEFNPILDCKGIIGNESTKLKNDYIDKLNKAKYKKEVDKIKEEAIKNNITIKDNSGFISRSERQCVNARVQGGAATMSKKAMIAVHNDKIINDLGFRLLIAVHDELIGECPEENKEAVKERLSYLMSNSALPEVTVPFKCDADDFKSWYLDVYTSEVIKEYNKLKENNSEDKAFDILCKNRCECLPEQLKEMIK